MILIIISYVRLYNRIGPDIVGKGPYAACADSRSVIFPEGYLPRTAVQKYEIRTKSVKSEC